MAQQYSFIKNNSFSKTFCMLALSLIFCACTKSTPQIPDNQLQQNANKALQMFAQSLDNNYEAQIHTKPYSLTGSIRISTNENSNRATYLIWSNGGHPLRFDLQAGIGASVAKIMETEKDILMYFPLDEKAIVTLSKTALNSLLSLDAPIPLTFLELSYLCRGLLNAYLEPLMLNEEKEQNKTKQEEIEKEESINPSIGAFISNHLVFSNKYSKNGEYAFNWKTHSPDDEFNYTKPRTSPFFTRVIVDENGLPIQYIIQDDWHIFIQYREKQTQNLTLQVPYKIKIQSLENDTNIILLIKEHNDTITYTKEQLTLILPEKTSIETYNF